MELLFSLGRERLLQEENKNKYSIEVESTGRHANEREREDGNKRRELRLEKMKKGNRL